jgi:hypothetical protein
MNPIKSPYQIMLDRLGLSPVQQSLSPQQMQAEMITRGQTPQHFQTGGRSLALASQPDLQPTLPLDVALPTMNPSLASKITSIGGKTLGGLGLLGSVSAIPKNIEDKKYTDAMINYSNALLSLGQIAPRLVPEFLGRLTGPVALYDALRPTEMGNATLDEWNRQKAAEEEEHRRRVLAMRQISPVVVSPTR